MKQPEAHQEMHHKNKKELLIWPQKSHDNTCMHILWSIQYIVHVSYYNVAYWCEISESRTNYHQNSFTVMNAALGWTEFPGQGLLISMGWCKKEVTPLLTHWSHVFLALTIRYSSCSHGISPSCGMWYMQSSANVITPAHLSPIPNVRAVTMALCMSL